MDGEALIGLYRPLNTLKAIDTDLWIADGPIENMAMYGTHLPFSTRMTIVRLSNGDLWCHSPIALTEELRKAVTDLGPVRHLVSPNKIHYAHIAEWARAFPEAMTWASPGVRERAAGQGMAVAFQEDLTDRAPVDWSQEIDQLVFRGSRFMDEVVFFHRQSRTLILADLIENFESNKVSWKVRWLLRFTGVLHPDGKLPLDLRTTFWGHKDEARRCFQVMLDWQPERVLLCHGRWYERDGTDELKRAFRWL
ncbi:DUF4336 domain-containing protein [Marinobacteraceae bacterium S3BR75-40.1]